MEETGELLQVDPSRRCSTAARPGPAPRPAVALTALVLAACAAVGPDYQPPESELPASWNQTASGPELEPGETGDLAEWWSRLNDPVLSALVEQALGGSLDLHAARARLREARARSVVAGADRAPEVTASGSASRADTTESGGATRQYSAGFDASWELDVFGGVRRRVEAAGADEESAAASLGEVRVSLVAEVARLYVEVRTLQSRLDITRDNLALQSETLQLTDWRNQAGLANTQDVEQARSNVEQTRALIPALELAQTEAEYGLDSLLGGVPGSVHERLAEAGDLPDVPERIVVGIPADALRKRADVRAAERSLAAETARVGVAEAARYPSFRLFGSIGIESRSDSLGSSGDGFASLLAGITAPIWRGESPLWSSARSRSSCCGCPAADRRCPPTRPRRSLSRR